MLLLWQKLSQAQIIAGKYVLSNIYNHDYSYGASFLGTQNCVDFCLKVTRNEAAVQTI